MSNDAAATDKAWELILGDQQLACARGRLCVHEMRLIIRHTLLARAETAERELAESRQREAALRDALEPFAKAAGRMQSAGPLRPSDDQPIWSDASAMAIKAGDLRRAAAALADTAGSDVGTK